jgi:hypothetical protein
VSVADHADQGSDQATEQEMTLRRLTASDHRDLVLGTGWTEIVALAAAFVIAVVATPAGISGVVLLLPFQVSVLGTPSPAVAPTNLPYNVVVPGVIGGSVIRVELLPSLGTGVSRPSCYSVLMVHEWSQCDFPKRPTGFYRPSLCLSWDPNAGDSRDAGGWIP